MGIKEEFNLIADCRTRIDKQNTLRRTCVAKVIDFQSDFVTCLTCDCCYGQNNLPTFCQRNSLDIDPREVYKNQDRAQKCKGWFPRDIGRRVSGEEYSHDDDRWYEKDSMA